MVCSLLQPKEALMYADVGSVSTKSNGNKSAQTPANKKYDDGVAYSTDSEVCVCVCMYM